MLLKICLTAFVLLIPSLFIAKTYEDKCNHNDYKMYHTYKMFYNIFAIITCICLWAIIITGPIYLITLIWEYA